MSSPSVIVYILSDGYLGSDSANNHLLTLFENAPGDYFEVISRCCDDFTGPLSEDKFNDKGVTISDTKQVLACLNDAFSKHSDKYVFLIKDTSVTHVTSHTLTNVVKTAIGLNSSDGEADWDLCYLCRWDDRCDLYDEKDKNFPSVTTKRGNKLVKSKSPHGLQAVVVSPRGRDIILGSAKDHNDEVFNCGKTKDLSLYLNGKIEKGGLHAVCIIPNIFEFNVLLAKNMSDYAKLSGCRRGGGRIRNDVSQRAHSKFWLFVLIVIILIIIGIWYKNKKKTELLANVGL